MDEDDEVLPNDVLQEILQQRNGESTTETTKSTPRNRNAMVRLQDLRPDELTTDEDNLRKVLARRSQDVAITNDDLYTGPEEGVTIDFGPEEEEEEDLGLPGAYSGAAGTSFQRLEKTRVPPSMAAQNHAGEDDSEFPIEAMDDAIHVEHAKIRVRVGYGRKVFVLLLGLMLLVVITTIVLPIVFLLEEEEVPATEESDWTPPSPDVSHLVPNLTQYTLEALKDPDSYQSSALVDVKRSLSWESYEPWRKQQRFALLCIYYGFDGISLWNRAGFQFRLSFDVECDWQYRQEDACNEDGHIEFLDISESEAILGFLAPEVAFLTHLKSIQISDLHISDAKGTGDPATLATLLPLPTIYALPPLLEYMSLTRTNLQGSIPSTLGLLTTLKHLDLGANQLTGTIPSELGLLTKLSTLVLSKNNLRGTIPEELGKLVSLEEFFLDNNTNIELSIPRSFCNEEFIGMKHLSTNWCSSRDECCEI